VVLSVAQVAVPLFIRKYGKEFLLMHHFAHIAKKGSK
jgi:hypothetical protein